MRNYEYYALTDDELFELTEDNEAGFELAARLDPVELEAQNDD